MSNREGNGRSLAEQIFRAPLPNGIYPRSLQRAPNGAVYGCSEAGVGTAHWPNSGVLTSMYSEHRTASNDESHSEVGVGSAYLRP